MTGKEIVDGKKKGKMFSRTITCQHAYNEIMKKFNEIELTAEYWHRGKDVFSKRDYMRDGRKKGQFKYASYDKKTGKGIGKPIKPHANEMHIYDKPTQTRRRVRDSDGVEHRYRMWE
jgi:hypothetical protein